MLRKKSIPIYSNTKSRRDACIDQTRLLLIIELKGIKDSIIDARDKGIKTHFITEITKDNIHIARRLSC
jgi:hypothetical protein